MKIKRHLYKRAWKYNGECSDIALSFSLVDKPEDRFLLVENIEPNYWSIHFCTIDKNSLEEDEKEALIEEISNYIKPGDYLSILGYTTPGGISGLNRFLQHGFVISGSRVVLSKETNQEVTVNILKKIYYENTEKI